VNVGGYLTGPTVDVNTVRQHVARGGTAIFDDIDRFVPAIADLAGELSNGLRLSSVVAFMTGASSAGLGLHVDRSDVIAVQLAGTKTWAVGEGLYGEGGASTPVPSVIASTIKTTGVTLRPGDILEVPAWRPHGTTKSTGISVHLAIQLFPEEFKRRTDDVFGGESRLKDRRVAEWFVNNQRAYQLAKGVSLSMQGDIITFQPASVRRTVTVRVGEGSEGAANALQGGIFYLHDLHRRLPMAQRILETLIQANLVVVAAMSDEVTR
jgi:hypothetical protein